MKSIIKKLVTLLSASLLTLMLLGCGDSNTGGGVPKVRIVLVAKDLAFRLDDQPELRNPPITLKHGQTVELVLRNDDPGHVLHCLSIGGLNVKTPGLASGQTQTVMIKPTERGTFTYACLTHPPMAGKLVVQ
jgi:plastocyanin